MSPIYNSAVQEPAGLQIVSPVLTNLARQYRPDGFIYDQVVAPMQVQLNIGQYPVFDPAYFFNDPGDIEVADRAPTPEITLKYSTSFYQLRNFRRKVTISNEERSQAHPALRLEMSLTTVLMSQMSVARELRLARVLRGPDNGGQFTQASTTPAVKWDQGTTATPATIQQDVRAAVRSVYNAIGKLPNTLILPYNVAYAISLDPTIQDLVKYQNGLPLLEMQERFLPANLFGLNVIIARGTKFGTGREGDPAMTTAEIWGNSARLLYVDQNAQWGQPTTVYSFRGPVGGQIADEAPTGAVSTGQTSGLAVVDRWVTPDPPVEHIRAWEKVDERVVAPDLGFEIANVLATP